jgi:hypothetical protein
MTIEQSTCFVPARSNARPGDRHDRGGVSVNLSIEIGNSSAGHLRGNLFGPNYVLFPTRQFRCYFRKIPLFRKAAVSPQAIETAGRPGAAAPGFFKNSLLIPLLPQIAKRFQGNGGGGMEAGPRSAAPRLRCPAGRRAAN